MKDYVLNYQPPRPCDVYKRCPICKTDKIFTVDVEVICLKCNWDSIATHVAMGGMDWYFKSRPTKSQKSKQNNGHADTTINFKKEEKIDEPISA